MKGIMKQSNGSERSGSRRALVLVMAALMVLNAMLFAALAEEAVPETDEAAEVIEEIETLEPEAEPAEADEAPIEILAEAVEDEAVELESFELSEGSDEMIDAVEEKSFEEAPNHTVEKIAEVEGTGCYVVVRYETESGIPEDAELTAWALDSGSHRAEDARRAACDGKNADCDLLLVAVSLVSGDMDYAGIYPYEVEVIMGRPVSSETEKVVAMRFDGDRPTLLDADADFCDAGIDRVAFRT